MIHNGTYTLTHATGHYTFKIKTQKDDARFAPGQRVVQLLVGADNEGDYRGFGFLRNGVVCLWRKSRQSAIYRRLATLIEKGAPRLGDEDRVTFEDRGRSYELLLSRRCLRCNRKLTTPESVKSGYGPECASRAGVAA